MESWGRLGDVDGTPGGREEEAPVALRDTVGKLGDDAEDAVGPAAVVTQDVVVTILVDVVVMEVDTGDKDVGFTGIIVAATLGRMATVGGMAVIGIVG